MNFNKILKASTFKLYIFIALLILMVAVGCSNKVDSSQTQAPPIPITGQESAKNTFGYTVEIPNGWRIINNDSKHLELATIEINNNNYFVNPSITIFIPDIYPEQSQDIFINNCLKGTISNIKLNDIIKETKYKVVAYECVQDSANKEYSCYYAFITTNKDFVVMLLIGDMEIKDKLKSIFYESVKTFKS